MLTCRPEDVWFHVSDLSSAHVYFRMSRDETWDTISKENIEAMCQLVKQNSIEGCKKEQVNIVYTLCKNLRKTAGMEVGSTS